MSRNFIAPALALVSGVFVGYYTFQPALRDYAEKSSHPPVLQESQKEHMDKHVERKDQPLSPGPVTIVDPGAPSSSSWSQRLGASGNRTSSSDAANQTK
ncbi:hypothetical protein MAP00_005907 [Monascus purpureus]|nr:hypothetical protein MAP00_005907 [Monascus purpureus]